MKNTIKGFTLVELLAVIVILAILMLIAMPAVLQSISSANRKTFVEFGDKVALQSITKFNSTELNDIELKSECIIYNIETELDLASTGKFKGYVLVHDDEDDIDTYITLFNDDFALVGFHYSDSSLKMIEHLKPRREVSDYLLTPSYLAGFSTCLDYQDNEEIKENTEYINKISTTLVSGPEFNNKIKTLAGSLSNIKNIERGSYLKEGVNKLNLALEGNMYAFWVWYENETLYYYCDAPKSIFLNSDSSKMFANLTNLTSIDLRDFDTSRVKILSSMFLNCSSLSSINVSRMNTSNVTTLESFFEGCSSLTTLDLKGFQTNKVESFKYMFKGCSALKSIDLSTFDTSNASFFTSMFSGCSSLISIDVSKFNTSKAKDLAAMFANCSSLITLDVTNFDTHLVENLNSMFNGCSLLKTIDVSHFNTSNVTKMASLFANCKSLTSADLRNFDTRNVTTLAAMFQMCHSLTSVDLSSFNTEKVESVGSMFFECKKLTKADLSSFYTPSLITMSRMFHQCNQLKTILMPHFDTSHVTSMNGVFAYVGVTELDLSSFDTSKVTIMSYMFDTNKNLNKIYISNLWSNKALKETTNMFYDTPRLAKGTGATDKERAQAAPIGNLTLKE